MATQPLEFKEFHGGITENFIDAPLNKYESATNLLITENKKLETRNGSLIYSTAYPQIPVGNQRIGSILDFQGSLILQSGKNFYRDSGTAWEAIVGPTSGAVLELCTISDYVSHSQWNDQLYVLSDNYTKLHKVYVDDVGNWNARTAGMPALASSPSLLGTAGTNNYIYAFHYYYEYKVGTVTHIDAGPTKQVQVLAINTPDVNAVAISAIPVLANTLGDNYDTANIRVKIYRTAANGTTLYLLGDVLNGTTTFTDALSDNTLANNGTIYTTGGVLDNDPPPLAKDIHIVNGVAYYINIKYSTGELLNNRLLQSVINDPDSVPATNYTDFTDSLVAITSYMDRPIVLGTKTVYRIEGTYDELGSNGTIVQRIADTIGCISRKSVVQTPFGVFFASEEGIAFTDGFKCFIVSNDFNTTYQSLTKTDNQKKRIYATFEKEYNRCYFSVQTSEATAADNDQIYVLDLRWGISENMPFTVLSGSASSFAPTAILFKNHDLYRADTRGFLFVHKVGLLSDPRIDLAQSVSAWGLAHIPYNFKSSAIKPSGKLRSFIPRIILSARNTSNLAVQISSDSDIGNRTRNMKPLRWRGNILWNDPLFVWNDSSFKWGVQGFVEQQRHFHSDDLRCTYKQISLSPADVVVNASKYMGTVGTTDNSATLDDATYSWTGDMVDYYIYFEDDNYTKGYQVTANTTATLTCVAGGLPIGVNKKWELRGKPKDEVLSLLSVTLLVSALGQTQEYYSPSSDGGNV